MTREHAPALAGSRQILARLQAEAIGVEKEIERLVEARQKIETVIQDCNEVEAQASVLRQKQSEELRAWATGPSAEGGASPPDHDPDASALLGRLAVAQGRRDAAQTASLALTSQIDALAKRLGTITQRVKEYALKAITEDTGEVLERLRAAHDEALGVESEIDAVRVILIEAAHSYFKPAPPEPDANGFFKPQIGDTPTEEVRRALLQSAERLSVEVRAARDGASSNNPGRHVARRAKWSKLADRLEHDASATVDDGIAVPPVHTMLDDVVLPAGFLK